MAKHQNLGPWTTSLDAGSRLGLSAFWKRRLEILPTLCTTTPRRKRAAAVAGAFILALAATPLLAVSDDPKPTAKDKSGDAPADVHAAGLREQFAASPQSTAKYGDVIERAVNDNGHGRYLIDFDSGKVFETPEDGEFRAYRSVFDWARARGIDAMGQVKSDYKGLIGIDMIAMPTHPESWNQPPGSVIENLEAGDPGTPANMDARASLPATFFVETREGTRGVLQITSIDESNSRPGPDNIRIRFKPIAGSSTQPTADQPLKSKPPKEKLQTNKPGKSKPEKSKPKQDKPAAGRDRGSSLLRRLRADAAPLLAALRDKYGYALADDQVLRRIAPPFPDERMQWYRLGNPSQADSIPRGPDTIFFRWEHGGPVNNGMQFGGADLGDILNSVAGVFPQDIEGPADLLDKNLPGDWVVRIDAPREKIVAALQDIVNRELGFGVRLRFSHVDRDVYVARGDYKFTPLPGQPKVDKTQLTDRVSVTDAIQVFGAELVPNSGSGGGMGEFSEFCEWVGRWIGAPLISEAAGAPREITWRLHAHSPFTKEQDRQARDPELVLANITKQTGLEFIKEKRPVEVLVIERAE